MLDRLPAVRAAVAGDPELQAAARDRRRQLVRAKADCAGDGACLVDALLWSDAQIDQLGDRLIVVLQRAGPVDEVAERQMRPSGRFQRLVDLNDPAMIRQAWVEAAHSVDHVLRVYGLAERKLNPMVFAAQYQQCPLIGGQSMLKDDHFVRYRQLPSAATSRVISVDCAESLSDKGAYTAMLVWGRDGNDHHLLEVVRARMDFTDMRAALIALIHRHLPN